VFIAGQFLDTHEAFEHQALATPPDIGDPHVAPTATGTPHQVIAAKVDAKESAHGPFTISRSTW